MAVPAEDILNSQDKVLQVAEEEIRQVVRVATAAVVEDVSNLPKQSPVSRTHVQGIVKEVFRRLKWEPVSQVDID